RAVYEVLDPGIDSLRRRLAHVVVGGQVLGHACFELRVALHLFGDGCGGVVANAVPGDARVGRASHRIRTASDQVRSRLLGDVIEVIVSGVAIGERILDCVVRIVPNAARLANRVRRRGGICGELRELAAAKAARDVATVTGALTI